MAGGGAWGQAGRRGIEDVLEQLRRNCTADSLMLVRSRRFGDFEAVALADALGANTSLRELLLAGHALSPAAAAALGGGLARNATLRRLTLGDASFGDAGVSALVTGGLGRNRGLEELDLEFRGLGAQGAKALAAAFGPDGGPPLKALLLGRNALGLRAGGKPAPQGAEDRTPEEEEERPGLAVLLAALGSYCPSLEALDLARNGLGGEDGASLGQALAGHPALTKLDLHGNPELGDAGVAGIAPLLAAPPGGRLAVLKLSGCGLGSLALAALAEALQARPGLVELDLSDSPDLSPGEPGLGLLLRALPPSLQCLRLARSAVEDSGAGLLAAVIAEGRTPQLQRLDLGRARLGPVGATAVARAVVGVGGVRELSLLGNTIGDAGAEALGQALAAAAAAPAGLQALDLTGTGLSAGALPGLFAAIAGVPSERRLGTLMLGGNQIGRPQRQAIAAFERQTGVDVAYDRDGGGEASDREPSRQDGPEEEQPAVGRSSGGGSGGSSSMQSLPPRPPDEVSSPFHAGDLVRVTGLVKAPHLNGAAGILTSELLNGRHACWLEEQRKSIAVRPSNLVARSS